MTRVLTEDEIAARNKLIERMQREQEIREKTTPPVQGQKVSELDLERCPHGIPLRKSCPKCDVVRPEDIQESVPWTRVS